MSKFVELQGHASVMLVVLAKMTRAARRGSFVIPLTSVWQWAIVLTTSIARKRDKSVELQGHASVMLVLLVKMQRTVWGSCFVMPLTSAWQWAIVLTTSIAWKRGKSVELQGPASVM